MHTQNAQNQGPQANQQFVQAQNQNNTKFEMGSELTQSTGQISRILATQKLVGLEIGSMGQANQNPYQGQTPNQNQFQNQYTNQNQNYQSNAQLEVDQATGPLSQILSQQSKQSQQ